MASVARADFSECTSQTPDVETATTQNHLFANAVTNAIVAVTGRAFASDIIEST